MHLKAFMSPPGGLSQHWTVSGHGRYFLTSKPNLRAAPNALSFSPWPLGHGKQTHPPHNSFVHVWQSLSSLSSWLPAPSYTHQDVFNSDPLLCVAVVCPQAGVTFNHPVFHWAEARQAPEGLHAGQSSFWTVVRGNLFLVKLSGHIVSKLQKFPLKIIHFFEMACSWQIHIDCHWLQELYCILFIYCIILSFTPWLKHFRGDVPAKKNTWSKSQEKLLEPAENKSKERLIHSY